MFSVCYICWGDGKNSYFPVICNTTYVPYNKVSRTFHFWRYSQISVQIPVNPLNANPAKWAHSDNSSATADEFFECVWPFSGVGA